MRSSDSEPLCVAYRPFKSLAYTPPLLPYFHRPLPLYLAVEIASSHPNSVEGARVRALRRKIRDLSQSVQYN